MLKLREVLLSEGEEEGRSSVSPTASPTPSLTKSRFSPLFPQTIGSLPDLVDLSHSPTRSASFDFGEAIKHANGLNVKKRHHGRNHKARNPKIKSANIPSVRIFHSVDEDEGITSLEFGMLRFKQRSSSVDKVRMSE